MNKTTISIGALVVALAGGVMFCSDAFEGDPTQTTTNDDTTTEPDQEPPAVDDQAWAHIEATFAVSDSPLPKFIAFRDGDGTWRQPGMDSARKLMVKDETGRYSLLTACDYEDAKGQRFIDVTLLEATVGELEKPRLICRAHSSDRQDAQLAGAVRNTGGEPVEVLIGSRRIQVENDKNAEGVLFATKVAKGHHTIAAQQGIGEKAVIAAARGVELREPANTVEIDMNDSIQITDATLPTYAHGPTYFAGGVAHLWLDGRTPLNVGPLETTFSEEGPVLHTRTTNHANDILDLTVQYKNLKPFWGVAALNVSEARFLTTGDAAGELVSPEFHWIRPTEVRVHDKSLDIAWKTANWAVFGFDSANDLSLLMPTAYVARVMQQTNARRTLDIVVTPRRASGPNPLYSVPDFNTVDGFDNAWTFRPSEEMFVKAGNLTAAAGKEKVVGAEAVAAYLENGSEFGPTGITTKTLSTFVTGLPPTIVDKTTKLPEHFTKLCENSRECIGKIAANPLAVAECPSLEAYRACEGADRAPDFRAEKSDFVEDLKREIVRWYALQDVVIPNALPRDEALAKITAEGVKTLKPITFDDDFGYDAGTYQVFFHVDPTRNDSRATWYGAYLFGHLVEIQPINLDYQVTEIDFPAFMEDMGLTKGATKRPALLDIDLPSVRDRLDGLRRAEIPGM